MSKIHIGIHTWNKVVAKEDWHCYDVWQEDPGYRYSPVIKSMTQYIDLIPSTGGKNYF